jgi:hypothetical protein
VKGTASRIVGQGKLLRSLRSLLARVERFALHRARTHDEQVWAACLSDRLQGALRSGLESPHARASLEHADRRATIHRKTPVSGNLSEFRRGTTPTVRERVQASEEVA